MLRGADAKTVRDGLPGRWPTRNSRRSTGAGSERTTGSSASTARSGGGRGSSNLPGRQLGPHAGDGEAGVHSGARVGKRRYLDMSKLEEMDEMRGMTEGQKRTGSRTAKSICERILTVPI